MFRFLKSKMFFLNVFLATVLLVAILWWVLRFLDNYTLHGESITIPDLYGFNIKELDSFLVEKKLRYVVMDSIYDTEAEKGVVIDQDPKPNSKVKQNRMLYLIVNAMSPPKVKVPKLVDLSLRRAIAMLETYGLKVGVLEYIPDMAKNAVLTQKIDDKEIKPGTMITKGSAVDLVLGNGLSDESVMVPLLIGMTTEEVLGVLKAHSLNEGALVYDISVRSSSDSVIAKVWKQNPAIDNASMISLGGYVDLWLTLLGDKINENIDE